MRAPDLAIVVSSLLVLSACDDTTGSGGAGGSGTTGSNTTTSTGSKSTTTGGTTSGSTGANGSTTGASMGTTTTGSGGDPFAAQRQACIDKINEFRATKGLPAYGRWTAAETCVDQQATADEMNDAPHGAWKNGTFPTCNGSGQNECLGQGPNGIESCLAQMWAEGAQPGCKGCDACNQAYNPNCADCDFYGMNGTVCGHYVNMSALYFTEAACGFSSLGGWDAINFH